MVLRQIRGCPDIPQSLINLIKGAAQSGSKRSSNSRKLPYVWLLEAACNILFLEQNSFLCIRRLELNEGYGAMACKHYVKKEPATTKTDG